MDDIIVFSCLFVGIETTKSAIGRYAKCSSSSEEILHYAVYQQMPQLSYLNDKLIRFWNHCGLWV